MVPLTYPDYNIDWTAVRAAVTSKTRLLIINTPHNPAGAVLSAADVQELMALVKGTDLVIVYTGARGTTCRQITPYQVGGGAVHAYCHLRGEERSFWLASIREAVALD